MRDVYVVGVGSTKYGKMRESVREGAALAALEAIENSKIDPRLIDGAFIANAFAVTERQGHVGPLVMSALGIPEKPASTIEAACASGASAFREAVVNVAGGFADAYMAIGVEKVSTLDTITATGYFAMGSDFVYEGACGASFPGLYAMLARAHMQRYGTTEEQLAAVAVKNHANAKHNEKAHFQKEITAEMHKESMVVSSPLRLYDACPFSDGAAAAIVATKEVAQRLGGPMIKVAGMGRAGSVASLPDRVATDLTTLPGAKLAMKQALDRWGKPASKIDFAEVHDCFTIAEIIASEDLGFFAPGTGAKAVEAGETKIGGRIPINPSGGLKAKGHPVGATGVGQIYEIYNQLAGKVNPARQVRGAKVGLAHNVGATGGSVAVTILEVEN
ncbi:MAG TPA: acetyl-CoA acetyltransferase [Candidatus Thermoplasmatota archaeon]|nr:acetyl-CoA acetyltransferase [Candidatus Thermoplasmatota archaeon]